MLLYCKKVGDKGELSLYKDSDHSFVGSLSQSVTSDIISICSHESRWFAVTDTRGKTLDVYSGDMKHHNRINLTFTPWAFNGVCAVKDYIFVSECIRDEQGRIQSGSNKLHALNWSGHHIACVEVEGDWVASIAAAGHGQIQLCSAHGDGPYLHVYSIE